VNETRAEKAQRLVDEGNVVMLSLCSPYQTARVQSGHRFYFVTLYADGHFFCTCKGSEWGDDHSYTDDLCTHALAVKRAVERDIPKDTDPPKEETCNKP